MCIASSYLLISRNYYSTHLATNMVCAYIYTKGDYSDHLLVRLITTADANQNGGELCMVGVTG